MTAPISLADLIESIITSLNLANASTLNGHDSAYFATAAAQTATAGSLATHTALAGAAHGGIVPWDAYGQHLVTGEFAGVESTSGSTLVLTAGTIYARPVAIATGGAINGGTTPRIRVATLDATSTVYAACYTQPNPAVQSWTKLMDLGNVSAATTGQKNLAGGTLVAIPNQTVVWFAVGCITGTPTLNAFEGTSALLPKRGDQQVPMSARMWTGFTDGTTGMPATLGAPVSVTLGSQRMPSILVAGV